MTTTTKKKGEDKKGKHANVCHSCSLAIVALMFVSKEEHTSISLISSAVQEQPRWLRRRHSLDLSTSKRTRIEQQRRCVSRTCVNALHSTYFTAFNSRASFSPCSNEVGFWRDFWSFSIVFGSSRRSIWVPTSKKGVLAQWCEISGTH